MTPVPWPEALPQKVLRDGFSYSPKSGVIRTTMDAGYPKVRKRFTAVRKEYNVSFSMTYEQLSTFEQFFNNPPDHSTLPGLFGGVWRFNLPDPIWKPGEGQVETDRPTIECRIVMEEGGEPYFVSPDGQTGDWIISFLMEKLP